MDDHGLIIVLILDCKRTDGVYKKGKTKTWGWRRNITLKKQPWGNFCSYLVLYKMSLSYLQIDNYFERNFRNGTELIEHQIISNFFFLAMSSLYSISSEVTSSVQQSTARNGCVMSC